MRALSILLAEDEPINRKVAVKVLEKLGHRVVVATNGAEAVEALFVDRFDIILMDVQMPVMDGLEATRIIRQQEQGSCVPIIAMTAFAMKGDRELCEAAGMDGYLEKPINFAEVEVVINGVVRKNPVQMEGGAFP